MARPQPSLRVDTPAVEPPVQQPESGAVEPSFLKSLLRRFRSVDHVVAMVDQGSMAITRFGALLVFARVMPVDDFGALSLVVSISFILYSAQAAIVVLPFIVSCRTESELDRGSTDWFWLDMMLSATVFVSLMAAWGIALALHCPLWIDNALFYSAIGAPPLMAFTFVRRWAYQRRNARLVLWMVAAYVLAFAAGTGLAWGYPHQQFIPYLTMALAPLAGLLVGLLSDRAHWRRPLPGLFGRLRHTLQFSMWTFLSFVAGAIYTNGMNVILAAFVGAGGSAAFGATRTVVAPIITLTMATDLIDKPRATRALMRGGLRGLRHSILATLGFLLILGTPYLLAVSFFSDEILDLLYGHKYAGLGYELQLWSVAMFLQMVSNPLSSHLVVAGNSRSLFVCGLGGAIVTLVVALGGLFLHGSVGIALTAMVIGRLVNFLMLWVAILRTKTVATVGAPAPLT